MKCPKCENEIQVGTAMKVSARGARIVTNPTAVLTIKCDKCGEVFQVSTSVKSMLSVKSDEN